MRRKPIHSVLAICACLGISVLQVASHAAADTAHVAADATILEGSTQKLGLATTIDVANVTAGASRMGVVRFDLGTVPAGSPIRRCLAQGLGFQGRPGRKHQNPAGAERLVGAHRNLARTDGGFDRARLEERREHQARYLPAVRSTAMVESWLDCTLANHGIALVASPAGKVSIQIDSKEATTTSHPMELEVVLAAASPECVDGDADGFFGQAACGTVVIAMTPSPGSC